MAGGCEPYENANMDVSQQNKDDMEKHYESQHMICQYVDDVLLRYHVHQIEQYKTKSRSATTFHYGSGDIRS